MSLAKIAKSVIYPRKIEVKDASNNIC